MTVAKFLRKLLGLLRPLRLGRIAGRMRWLAVANLILIRIFHVLVIVGGDSPEAALLGAPVWLMTALGFSGSGEPGWKRIWLSVLVLVTALVALGQLACGRHRPTRVRTW